MKLKNTLCDCNDSKPVQEPGPFDTTYASQISKAA